MQDNKINDGASVEPIAIIGMGCRFPGIKDCPTDSPQAFWHLLNTGKDILREIPASRWDVDTYYDPERSAPGKMYVRKGYFLDNVDQFDAQFFNLAPKEADSLDPQQRLMLEVSWEALEAANVNPAAIINSQTGVFVGTSWDDYSSQRLYASAPTAIDRYSLLSNQRSSVSGRIAHLLGVHGPALTIDTACASSLSAVHLASQSLRYGECDLALAGGVFLVLAPETMVGFCRLGLLSTDGRTRAFSHDADGFGQGEGAGVVLLKRLCDAKADGDQVLAVIRGSAINHNGPSRTATSANGLAQQAVMRQALRSAGVAPHQVNYVETHGSSTGLGDPIEAFAIAEVFGQNRTTPLTIGSVKTNIGNLSATAGMASLIKVVLSLQHRQIPANLHVNQLSSRIPWQKLGLTIPTQVASWPADDTPCLAGVSAFGLSGSNAHLIVEEAPTQSAVCSQPDAQPSHPRPYHLLCLSAKTSDALQAQIQRYSDYLHQNPDTTLTNICYTAATCRQQFSHRLALVVNSVAQATAELATLKNSIVSELTAHSNYGFVRRKKTTHVAFLFPGQGAEYVGMGTQLYNTQPTFKRALDHCAELLSTELDTPLLEVLFPAAEQDENSANLLTQPIYSQPALFSIEYALYQLWQSWGIQPTAVMGHDVGQYVAACVAEVFCLADGLKLAAVRGRLMQQLSAKETTSSSIASARAEFQHVAQQIDYATPQLPLIIGGIKQATADIVATVVHDPTLASENSEKGLDTLQQQGCDVLLECGPQQTLWEMGHQREEMGLWLTSLHPHQEDWHQMLNSLIQLHLRGCAVDWVGFDRDYPGQCKVSLPTYPFQRQRHWIDLVVPQGVNLKDTEGISQQQSQTETCVPPRTLTEKALASIWQEVLKVEFLGIRNDFFALGGDSLLATQVISRIANQLSIEIDLQELFQFPTLELLAKLVDIELQDSKQQDIQAITSVSRQQPLRLSFTQQRFWFQDQLGRGTAYNRPITFELRGVVDLGTLRQTLQEIVNRHESLRTTFAVEAGTPYQVIHNEITIDLPVVDLSKLGAQDQSTEVNRLIHLEATRPFDLGCDPMLRATLLCLNAQIIDGHYVLLVTCHHIAIDGWSLWVLENEFIALYQAFSQGHPSPLPTLSIQYADFAQWQRERLSGDVLATQLSYWKQQLAGMPPLLELSTDYPRPPQLDYRAEQVTFAFSKSLTDGLHALSQQTGVTLFMTLLAGLASLLYRYTQQENIVIGSPIANRNRVELEPLIGCFINLLVLRTKFSETLNFKELLGHVHQLTLNAYAHQDLPFDQLVDALQPERSLAYAPLFQVMFVLQNTPQSVQQLADLYVQTETFEYEADLVDLFLSMHDGEDGLTGVLTYNATLFSSTTIDRMVEHFQILLTGILDNPRQSIATLSMLSDAEQHQLLVAWNNTQADYAEDKCLHQLFEAQGERTPEAIAVVFEDQQVTYQELNTRTNQLAHYLQTLGVGSESLVGIYLEHSIEMVVGVLSILKAGGAYVPLDPAYPQERLILMVEDAEITVLLTQPHLCLDIPHVQTVVLDNCWETISDFTNGTELPQTGVTSTDLAYVIYTSGSTGKPKGVQVSHRSAVNLLCSVQKQPGLTAADTLLALASLSFDISISEIFLPLMVGAKLVLVNRAVASDGFQLLKAMEVHKPTFMQPTPATWQMLLTAGWTGNPELTMISTGEPLPQSLAAELLPLGKELWNLYGPTETTIWASGYQIKTAHEPITIGYPMANTQFFILDQHMQPLPVGIPGELYIGGRGVARGYLNRLELNAERFIENPFSANPAARLYKTGDLACWLPNGQVECLGRLDYQVKIRGFRIELGEIETALINYPHIREAVVVARKDDNHDRLVAYLVTSSPLNIRKLHDNLKRQLPEYMVPSAFVVLDQLPLTPNGKIDRRALPAPDSSHHVLETVFMTPTTPTEERLCQIWCEVLQLEKVGIHDNFFELGGHSLLATQVISRIRAIFYVELSLRMLFEFPTVAGLAIELDNPDVVVAQSTIPIVKRQVQSVSRQLHRRSQL